MYPPSLPPQFLIELLVSMRINWKEVDFSMERKVAEN
jgi:hypothetical protein